MPGMSMSPDLAMFVESERRRRMQEEDGPERMQFFDQGVGMMPRSAPSDFAPPTADENAINRLMPTMPTGRAAFLAPPASPAAPIPDPSAVPTLPPPPPPNGQLGGLEGNPFLSSIVTGSGTRTMAFPQGPGGTFGRGQDLGMVPFDGPQNPADALRSSFMRNLYGTGAPSSFLPAPLAAEMALGEMRNRTLQQEGELQRQNLMERERLEQQGRVEAAQQSHRHGQSAAQYQAGVNAFLSGQGPQFAQADAFARSLGGQTAGMGGAGGPAAPAGAVPALPVGMAPPADPDAMAKVNRLLMQSTADLPKNFAYEIPGIGMGANRKPAMSIGGALEGKVTPEIANRLLGRFSSEGFGEKEFGALSEALGRSPGGQDVRKALIGQMMTDELAYRPPPAQGSSGNVIPLIPGILGRTQVYPEKLGYGDIFPGAQLQAGPAETWVGQGLKSFRDRMYSGGLPYRSVNIGGEMIPIDPGASQATLASVFGGAEAIRRGIEARRGTYGPLYKALAGSAAR